MAGTIRKRTPHTQTLTIADRKAPKRVDHVQFIAHVNANIKFDTHNALVVTLLIPPEFVEDALDIRYMAGLPLSVDIQKWRVVPKPSPPSPDWTPRVIVQHTPDAQVGNG